MPQEQRPHVFPATRVVCSPLVPLWRTATALTALSLLAACTSTPLPHWPDAQQQPRIPPPRAATVVPGAPSAPVTTTPVAPVTSPQDSALESAAVAAHFPPPNQQYNTPGLQAGRNVFTTQPELLQWLDREASAAQSQSSKARVLRLGTNAQGDMMAGILLTRAAGLEPAQLDESGRPTVFLVGQQATNAAVSAEALLVITQELARGALAPLLDSINVVILPRAATADTQPAPATDHLALRTPEARGIAQLLRDYRPMVVLDLQEFPAGELFKDKFQGVRSHDAMLQMASTPNTHEFLQKSAHEWFLPAMQQAFTTQGLRSDWDQLTTNDLQDLRVSSGWMGAQYLHNAAALRNAVGMVVRGRGSDLGRLHLQRRTHTLVTATKAVLETTATRASSLEQVRSYVAREISSQACNGRVVISAQPSAQVRVLDLLDPATGQPRQVRVNSLSAQQLLPVATRARPCGYWIAASAIEAGDRLRQFGVPVLKVAESGLLMGERFESADNQTARLQPMRTAIQVPAGSYYVSLNQPLANLVSAALEADAPGAFFPQQLLGSVHDVARVTATPSVIFEEAE